RGYGLLTLHRPSNVDDHDTLAGIMGAVCQLTSDMPILFAVHPRTKAKLEEFELHDMLSAATDLRLLPPLGYLEFLALQAQAKLILTDSGGIQEESTCLGVPCLTLRENTERPVTITEGTNPL